MQHSRVFTATLTGFILIRFGVMSLVMVTVSVVVFFLMEAAPGDVASQFLGERATPERLTTMREDLGLERSTWARYLEWIGGVFVGDLGRSLGSGRSVTELIALPAARTAVLAGVAFIGVLIIGVVGGVRAGYRAGSPTDRALSMLALIGLSIPEFVVGIILIVIFALGLRVLPAVSLMPSSESLADRPDILILPATALAIVAGCYVFRLVRGIVASAVSRANVEAARLDGISPIRMLLVHVLPPTAGSTITAVVFIVPYLIGGAVVVEQLFGYPGLGSVLISAVNDRDQPLVLAIILILSAITVTGYALADVLARVADPYLRRQS